jgi:hypothetical protein
MTLQAEAARQVASERYRAASITSGERYVADRRSAEQAAAAAEQSQADAAHRAELPVIVGERAPAAPANELVTGGVCPAGYCPKWAEAPRGDGSIRRCRPLMPWPR